MEECEYIVERVIARRCEPLCFRGHIMANGLSPGLCPPLRLCSARVTDIRSCGSRDELELTLLLTVRDARGCPGEGMACLRLAACTPCTPCDMGDSLRRGAQVQIAEASFVPPCGFFVCLNIELHTLVSRSELACCPPCACARPACPSLPLYPPPPKPNRTCCLTACRQ